MRTIIVICLFLALPSMLMAQENDTLVLAKNRFITSLIGSLSNESVNISGGGKIISNGYSIGTKSGWFLKNHWVLGLNFSLGKSEFSNGSLGLDLEELNLGLWSRLYFADKGAAALYFDLSPFYTSLNRITIFHDDNNVLIKNEEVSGNGFGISPGLGFTYIINRNVGFGMSVSYAYAHINATVTDLIQNTSAPSAFDDNKLLFGFDFQIYLDQFFF